MFYCFAINHTQGIYNLLAYETRQMYSLYNIYVEHNHRDSVFNSLDIQVQKNRYFFL